MTLSSKFTVTAVANLRSALDLATASVPLSKVYSTTLDDGTSVGKADLVFHDTRSLGASASEDLDLAGVLTSPLGATLTFARIKAIVVAAAAANTNDVLVGAASANQWATLLNAAGVVRLRPGGFFAAAAGVDDATGWAVTAGTGDLLKIANSAGTTSVSYDIIIVGSSA